MEEVVLAERRKRQKWSQDPRNTFWTNDKSKFGFRMLEKMGWHDGKGLGVNEDGNKEHIKIHKKDDNLGVGAKKSRDEDWIAQQDSFDALLADLNEVKNERKTTEVKQLLATAGECKKLMYHNFLKSKDLSMRTNEDIDCVFGRRRKRSEREQKCEEEESCDLTVYHGITTIKSAVSLDEYFSTKQEFIKTTKPNEDQKVDSPQKKKRKTKSRLGSKDNYARVRRSHETSIQIIINSPSIQRCSLYLLNTAVGYCYF